MSPGEACTAEKTLHFSEEAPANTQSASSHVAQEGLRPVLRGFVLTTSCCCDRAFVRPSLRGNAEAESLVKNGSRSATSSLIHAEALTCKRSS